YNRCQPLSARQLRRARPQRPRRQRQREARERRDDVASVADGVAVADDGPGEGGADLRVYRFFAGGPFWATAAFTSALNAPASTFSPSWMSIALRVLPSKLELKRRDGSGILAPRANVSFTTFVYASPVQTIPWCDQTGVPIHFHSSVISGSASRISARMRARVSPRHPPRSRIRWSMSREAGFPVARSRLLIPARTAPSMGSVPLCLSEPVAPGDEPDGP